MGDTLIGSPLKSDWFTRLLDLEATSLVCFEDEQAAAIRQMWHLIDEAPDFRWIRGLRVPDQGRFECMLAAGYYQCAVESFFKPESTIMLSRDCTGYYLATVVLPAGRSSEACGDTPALALVGALASVLAEDGLLLTDLDHPRVEARQAA